MLVSPDRRKPSPAYFSVMAPVLAGWCEVDVQVEEIEEVGCLSGFLWPGSYPWAAVSDNAGNILYLEYFRRI